MLTEEKLAAERKFIKEQLVKIITDSVESYKSALGALQGFCAADEIPVNIPVIVVTENNTGIIGFRTRSVSVSPYSNSDDAALRGLPIFDPTSSVPIPGPLLKSGNDKEQSPVVREVPNSSDGDSTDEVLYKEFEAIVKYCQCSFNDKIVSFNELMTHLMTLRSTHFSIMQHVLVQVNGNGVFYNMLDLELYNTDTAQRLSGIDKTFAELISSYAGSAKLEVSGSCSAIYLPPPSGNGISHLEINLDITPLKDRCIVLSNTASVCNNKDSVLNNSKIISELADDVNNISGSSVLCPAPSATFSEAYAHLKVSMLKLGRDGMGVRNALTETFKVHSDALANTNFRIKNTSVDRLGSSIEAFIDDFLNLYFVYDKVSIVLNAFRVEHDLYPETEIIFDVTRL